MDYLRPRIESFDTILKPKQEEECNLSLKELLVKEKQNKYTLKEYKKLFELIEKDQQADYKTDFIEIQKHIFQIRNNSKLEYRVDDLLWRIWHETLNCIFLHKCNTNYQSIDAFLYDYGNIYSNTCLQNCVYYLTNIGNIQLKNTLENYSNRTVVIDFNQKTNVVLKYLPLK